MTKLKSFIGLSLAGVLALGLSACGSKTDENAAVSGEPIAAIPAPAGTDWTETVTISKEDGYILGNPNAPIKLMEYASLTCPHCADFAKEAAEPLTQKYVASGRVSYELRNQIHGPHDLALATMVRCGAKEGYHPLSEQIWANMQSLLDPIFKNSQQIEQAIALPADQRLVKIAEVGQFFDFFSARGLSKDQATQCLADEAKYTKIAENSQKQSDELDITGTPTFFLNGQKLDGNTWKAVEIGLQKAGARDK